MLSRTGSPDGAAIARPRASGSPTTAASKKAAFLSRSASRAAACSTAVAMDASAIAAALPTATSLGRGPNTGDSRYFLRDEGVVLVTRMALASSETRPMKPSSRPFSGMGLRQVARATLAAGHLGNRHGARPRRVDEVRRPVRDLGRPREELHVVGEGPPRLLENSDATYTREGEGHNRIIFTKHTADPRTAVFCSPPSKDCMAKHSRIMAGGG